MRMVAPLRQPVIQIRVGILRLRFNGLNLDLPLWINPHGGYGKAGGSNRLYSARDIAWAESPSSFGHEIFLI
jgi:hypothetical protein